MFEKEEQSSKVIKIFLKKEGKEIARAYIYLIKNNLHDKPYALLEDVFVEEAERGKGYGRKLVEATIEEAKNQGCYKIIGTSRYSRPKVHTLYEDIGFQDHGKEFRLDF